MASSLGRPRGADAPWMVLIGPAGAGKTTVGRELAARTLRRFVDLDAVADDYYADMGWSIERLQDRIAAVGRVAAEAEWEPARAYAVARAVADNPETVLAVGAGHTCYTDTRQWAIARAALDGCANVVRLLPSPDRNASLALLRQRCLADKGRSWILDGHDFLARWLDDPNAELVATSTVYTSGESPARTADRIIRDSVRFDRG